jgi:hypothetical protein
MTNDNDRPWACQGLSLQERDRTQTISMLQMKTAQATEFIVFYSNRECENEKTPICAFNLLECKIF